jgi:hypothetical protein
VTATDEQLVLAPPRQRFGFDDLDVLAERIRSELASAQEDVELRRHPRSRPCRCARPWPEYRHHCIKCGHDREEALST